MLRDRCYNSKQIASALGVSERHALRLASSEGWAYREMVRGKKKEKRFYLSALPEPVQVKLRGTALIVKGDSPIARLELSSWQRAQADARLTALELFSEFFKNSFHTKREALKKFCNTWSSRASEKALKELPSISERSLSRWEHDYKKGGVLALAPKYGLHRTGTTKLPEEFQSFVLQTYLNQHRVPLATIYTTIIHTWAEMQLGGKVSLAELEAKKEELKKVFTIKAVSNFIENNSVSGTRLKLRGNKRQQDLVRPYVSRTRENLRSNEIWVSDGHDANTFVIDDMGKIVRPVIVAWMDEKSRFVTGWDIDTTENTGLIISSLLNSVQLHGAPKYVYVDNGKAYINKITSDKYNKEKELKLYSQLGCSVMNAAPYNAREKSIERLWGTLDNHAKLLPGYAGKHSGDKPQSTELAVKNKQLLTLEEYKDSIEKIFAKYNTDPHTGEGMEGRTPYQVYMAHISHPRFVDEETLQYWRLVHLPDIRIIAGGGRVRVNKRVYMHEELLANVGENVEVALDPQNLDRAYIFLKGSLLCIAESEVKADYFTTPNTIEALKRQSKATAKMKKLTKQIREIQSEQSSLIITEIMESKTLVNNKPKRIDFLDI